MADESGDNVLQTEPLQEPGSRETSSHSRSILVKQVLLAMVGSLGHFCLGATQTWPSAALHDISANNETLVGSQLSLTTVEKDLTGSIWFPGSLLGTWAAGWLADAWGRRVLMQAVSGPFILGWLLTGLASSPGVLLTGRFILGVGSGMVSVTATSYVLELAESRLRGALSMMPNLGITLGCQYTLWVGTVIPWHYLSFVCIIPSLIMLLAFIRMPESPSYLVIRTRYKEAAAVLTRLRGRHANIEEEMEDLKMHNLDCSKTKGYRGLLSVRNLKRVAVVLGLFAFQQLSGNFVLIVHTARVLQSSGVTLDPGISSGVALSARVVGVVVGFSLVDRLGRRPCLAISHAINAASLAVLGTFVYFQGPHYSNTSLSWVPLLCVAISLFAGDIGLESIPFILSAEYFPTSVRTHASAVCMIFFTVAGFVVVQLYSVMQEGLGVAGLYWFYGASSCLAVVYCLTAVTETKGRPVG